MADAISARASTPATTKLLLPENMLSMSGLCFGKPELRYVVIETGRLWESVND